ncbi:MAG: hypothetical protein E7220_04705 [Clostridiales bacterium]|nr:hypothetical protein [Clostridiales bacterium]
MNNAVYRLKSYIEDIVSDRKTLLKILSIILILLTAVVIRISGYSGADKDTEQEITDTASVNICVDISGSVLKPGVYNVSSDTRLFEVIEMAGGLTSDADTDSINRAAYVEDGQKIIIPARIEQDDEESDTDGENEITGSDQTSSDTGGNGGISQVGLININTATADELKTLNGIGDVMAGRIIEYRASNRFRTKEDIKSVKGIGDSTYDKIKDSITV